ncbi:radical SAM protein [Clostridium sp. P21]|uniref:Radical SAM protein n=1 Tax=Clostridium muellerianum TaxID=2716538 RepID=A0A7Y0HQ46_9CLOT|nr:radical SAM protein [Clostridium muellerianum]NMM65729.1 radical SAM protein [Clostridium muellerianum]
MKKFKKFYIEITNVCNLSCDFCPQTKRSPEFMKVETFSEILDQIKMHTDYIYFHVKGEPFLHPEIDSFLDLSYEKGFKVNITTNGTLINKVKEKILKKPFIRQINFSLHSFDGNETINGKDEYINNIISFVKEAVQSTEMLISLRLWNLEKDDSSKIEKNRYILQMIEKAFNLPYKIEEKIIPGKGIKVCDRVYLNQEYKFQWPDLNEKEDNSSSFCHGLRNQVGILVDGTVIPCCLDGEGIINLGNIHQVNFSKIVESDRANNLFNGFSSRKVVEELCRKCGYKKRFNI